LSMTSTIRLPVRLARATSSSALSRNDPPMLSKSGPEGDHDERA
jgi:hypothetical protein